MVQVQLQTICRCLYKHILLVYTIASYNDERRKFFGDKYNNTNNLRFDDYDSLLNCELVDAVTHQHYITPHADLSIKAAEKVTFCVKNQVQQILNKGRK